MAHWLAVDHIVDNHLHLSMEVTLALIVGNDSLFRTVEGQSFTLGSRTDLGNIIQTEHHILRGHGNRCAISRIQDIMTLKHQQLSLKDGLVRQWEVDSHLVTVEVGVESRTCQRMELDGLTLDKFRLESLDTQTVQCRSTVQQYGMTLHHILEDIPDDRLTTVHNLLGTLHRLHNTALDELTDDERLIELGSHQLRQTALTHLQLRTDNDYRTC